MRRFYASPDSFSDNTVTLDADEARHAHSVLRLCAGDEISVFDGEGREFCCAIKTLEKSTCQATVLDQTDSRSPESPFALVLAVALLKGEKFDLVVQKAVELGVTALVPLETVRCDVKPKEGSSRLSRWRKIAMEATRQCGRARLMSVVEPVPFPHLVKPGGSQYVMFSERGGIGFSQLGLSGSATAVIGPEGGRDDSELELAEKAGAAIITLGGRILRAETAAISIAAVLQHRFGDLN